jgi:Asp-tRNA(Asn)/Glu-tRNA(Gln) amidotransferase A subunit family amidase
LRAANGLPVGLQLVGRKGDDVRLCAVASDLEQRLPNIVHPGPKRGPNRMSSD